MGYPKILPWLARKAMVPIPVAERLWDQSINDGDRHFPRGLRGPAYWRRVIRSFRAALTAQGQRPHRPCHAEPELDAAFSLYVLHIRFLNRAWWTWAGFLRRAFSAGPNLLRALDPRA